MASPSRRGSLESVGAAKAKAKAKPPRGGKPRGEGRGQGMGEERGEGVANSEEGTLSSLSEADPDYDSHSVTETIEP